MPNPINIAIIGCGFVADYYMATLHAYPNLHIVGVYDKDTTRLYQFCTYYTLTSYPSLDAVLEDQSVELVLNLTNPRAHYALSKQCLQANKHVYSEKPLAMSFDEAQELTELAKQKGLQIISAPCSVLGKATKTFYGVYALTV